MQLNCCYFFRLIKLLKMGTEDFLINYCNSSFWVSLAKKIVENIFCVQNFLVIKYYFNIKICCNLYNTCSTSKKRYLKILLLQFKFGIFKEKTI